MSPENRAGSARIFPWTETAQVLRALAAQGPLRTCADGRRLFGIAGEDSVRWEVTLPLLQALPRGEFDFEAYLTGLGCPPETVFLLLLQAGACAMGLWRDGRLVRHKVIKKYVVRGTGRAQPGYLKTRGKSRYGSRLRLRNAEALLEEANAKMGDWWEAEGAFARAFVSCPVRLWPELYAVEPTPPFPRRGFHAGVPLTVRVPSFDELRRVWWHLSHGRLSPVPSE